MAEEHGKDDAGETRAMRKVRRTSIGPYPIQARIGEGGMGAVYRCTDPQLGRLVAVKVLSDERLREPESRERFLREARAIARLSHPNVVQIHAVDPGGEGGAPYFVMEFVAGPSVEDRLREGPAFSPEEAARIVLDAARGLREAHRRGLIHRDIKPSNILLDEGGCAKIADFGLVKEIRPGPDGSDDGIIVGTPHYISPEQGQGKPVDHRADIYSLGATLYHMLAGAPPFEGSSQISTIVAHVTTPLPSLRERCPRVPPPLAAIVERMMAKAPEDRYATYDDLIHDLQRFRGARARKRRAALAGAVVGGAIGAGVAVALVVSRILTPGLFAAFPAGTVARARGGGGEEIEFYRNDFRHGLRELEVFWPAGSPPARVDPGAAGQGVLIIRGERLAPADRPSARLVGIPLRHLETVELRGLELRDLSHLALAYGRFEAPSRYLEVVLREGTPNRSDALLWIVRSGEREPLRPEGQPLAFPVAGRHAYDVAVRLEGSPEGSRAVRIEIRRLVQGRAPVRVLEARYRLPRLARDDWAAGSPRIEVDRFGTPYGIALDEVRLRGRLDRDRWRALRAGKETWRRSS